MTETRAGRLVNRLRRATGRDGNAAADLPAGLAANLIRSKGLALLRGAVRLRRPVFLDAGVHLRGKHGITLGRGVSVGRGTSIDGYAQAGVRLGQASHVGEYCVITCTSHVSRLGRGFTLGADSGMGDFCHVGASGGVTIGRDVIMGSYVSFHSQEHNFGDTKLPIRLQGTTELGIQVEDGCWLGARVTVLDGSRIGAGSVVAAGAVVRGEFPANSIIAGVPARVVKRIGT